MPINVVGQDVQRSEVDVEKGAHALNTLKYTLGIHVDQEVGRPGDGHWPTGDDGVGGRVREDDLRLVAVEEEAPCWIDHDQSVVGNQHRKE